jgi:hypothetical protein
MGIIMAQYFRGGSAESDYMHSACILIECIPF